MRFVIDQDQLAWLDPHLKAPGRGAHLCYAKACVDLAWKKKSLSASFKTAVTLPSREKFQRDFIDAQLKKISNLIGLARRRGEIISGLNMLERPKTPILFLILASDIAEQSKASLLGPFRPNHGARSAQAPFLPIPDESAVLEPEEKALILLEDTLKEQWSGETLGALIGKAHRVALGVTSRDIAERLSLEILRISQVLVASSP